MLLLFYHSIYSHIFKPFRFISFYFMIFRSVLNGFFCLMLVLSLFLAVSFFKFSIWFYMTFSSSLTCYFKKQSIEKSGNICNFSGTFLIWYFIIIISTCIFVIIMIFYQIHNIWYLNLQPNVSVDAELSAL